MKRCNRAPGRAVLALACAAVTACAQQYELKTDVATLSIDKGGDTLVIADKANTRRMTGKISRWWGLTVRNKRTNRACEATLAKNISINQANGSLRVSAAELTAGAEALPFRAEFVITTEGDAFCFSGSVAGASDEWEVEEVRCSNDTVIEFAGKEPAVYWPHDLGLRFDNPRDFGSRSFEYPGTRGTMAWFSLNDEGRGIYIGSHDAGRGAKKFSLGYSEAARSFKFNLSAPVFDRSFAIPGIVVKYYNGTWHEAARTYRGWFDKTFKRAKAPDWLRSNEGFMLTIFKQQNGDVMWNYSELDKLCDIGEKLNFKLLGIWGWGVGGHDRLYPNYPPDNLLGGRVELKKAIERAHKRGFKVVVYSNGTLIDAATDYYAYNGLDTVLQDAEGRPVLDFYVKYNNATPVIFTRACPGSSVWRNTIMNAALAAKELGVDAFYIDQVGVRGPDLCYSTRHDHLHPQESHTQYRVAMMKGIRDKLRETDPDFCIITEGTTDSLLEDVDCFHSIWNCGLARPGARGGSRATHQFPELYRYTFPETVIIYLNSLPVLPRWDANYSAVYGLRHEIMSRYPADAELLRHGKMPVAQDYSTVRMPPDVGLINEVPAEEATRYIYNLTKWRSENADIMMRGNFIDEEGIKAGGQDILAKGFANGAKIGVVVWNTNVAAKREFTVNIPGYRLAGASAPGQATAEAFAPLEGNSVRLLTFERDRK